ncbi:hypothetical protein E4634_06435 [Mangrovimicrobium sediminis]|uniref:histidine kinase n=1 Tax=Mangrovimicrobium sediminis TaxID=2562682 RepID=A0A4Z0M5Y9_9GAMM|nr:ATP-binding protein [Haliea sp. SAOS-164]TGD74830.1 hypothetical protein E4634_06435 [Haliea sp. SAOS-164]
MSALPRSLNGRLVLASLLLFPLFLGTSSLFLGGSHRRSLEAAEEQRLQLHVMTLLAQAEYDGAITLPQRLIEARYGRSNSGLYAVITAADGTPLWQSPSAATLPDDSGRNTTPGLQPGEHVFQRRGDLYTLSWQVLWETDSNSAVPLQFTVMESAEALDAEIAVYRRALALWLGGSAALLVVLQAAILAWGLRPLRSLASRIAAIETGGAEHLEGNYPREIQALTDNLNTLLRGERQRRERVRNTLADLAHSLKTPLAVVRGADKQADDYPQLVEEQVERMQQIVSYQLQRASGGSHKLLQRIPVQPLLIRLRDTLAKVYADRELQLELVCDDERDFRGDERDFLEVAGNVLDNACKHARTRVRVSACGDTSGALELVVEDDGTGIPGAAREAIVQRGTRLDQRSPGQGLGLAVAADIVESYGGKLEIGEAALGGAQVRIYFP